MKRIGAITFRIVLVAAAQFFLLGCLTKACRNDIRWSPRYHPEQYPLSISGMEFGMFMQAGVTYRHFYFAHFPWPTHRGQMMHVFLPVQSDRPPIFMNTSADLPKNELRNIEEISYYDYYRGGKYVGLKVPKSTMEIPTKPAMLYVTTSPKQLPTCGLPMETLVHLNATKEGPDSIVRVGTVDEKDEVHWSEPWTLQVAPFEGHWKNPFSYAYYLLAVPFDILTSPIQAIPYLLYYPVGRGMSPT